MLDAADGSLTTDGELLLSRAHVGVPMQFFRPLCDKTDGDKEYKGTC
jgi:hypothetical protein